MNKLNFLSPDKNNLYAYLYSGISLFSLIRENKLIPEYKYAYRLFLSGDKKFNLFIIFL